MMSSSFWVRAGGLMAFLAVVLGAFGAHGLKAVLSDEMKAVYEMGARYHFYHSLGLFVTAWLSSRSESRAVAAAGWCFLGGILLFSGSLYLLSVTGVKKLAMATPAGGLLFLAGWLCLAFSGA